MRIPVLCRSARKSSVPRGRRSVAGFLAWALLVGIAPVAAPARAAELTPSGKGAAAKPPPAKPVVKVKPLQWQTSLPLAAQLARKQNKLVLAYFCGSDWCEWCKKVEEDVLQTEKFRQWADQNVILLMIDFPRNKVLSGMVKDQNDKLRDKFSVAKTPTFIFMDPDGLLVARAGYDTAKLREDEKEGDPAAWIKFCDETVQNRPKTEVVIEQKGLDEAKAYAHKHFLPLLVLVTKGKLDYATKQKEELLRNQPFVRFINRNMAFTQAEWPEETDHSPEAITFRAFIEKQKLTPAPIQLLVWNCMNDKVEARINGIVTQPIDPLLSRLERELPGIDYTGKWLDDYRMAQAISSQTKRPIFMIFTSMDSSEYCQKFDEEIFKTEEFKKYANKNLVMVRVDFPTKTQQPDALKEQNKRLADQFAVRGFPSVVILNPLGRKIGDSKYQKGGPGPFLAELDTLVKANAARFGR